MKKITILLFLTAFVFLNAGCMRYWYQEGVTFNECALDLQQCRTELTKYTDLRHATDYERKFMEDCMQQKGYRLVTVDELPLRVKRRDPETSVDWRMNGIAGTLDE